MTVSLDRLNLFHSLRTRHGERDAATDGSAVRLYPLSRAGCNGQLRREACSHRPMSMRRIALTLAVVVASGEFYLKFERCWCSWGCPRLAPRGQLLHKGRMLTTRLAEGADVATEETSTEDGKGDETKSASTNTEQQYMWTPDGIELIQTYGMSTRMGYPVVGDLVTEEQFKVGRDVAYASVDQLLEKKVIVEFVARAPDAPNAPPLLLGYSMSPAKYEVGVAAPSNRPVSTGSVNYFSVHPSLPKGLIFHIGTGCITGTPEASAERSTYQVTAASTTGSASIFDLVIIVQEPMVQAVLERAQPPLFRPKRFRGGITDLMQAASDGRILTVGKLLNTGGENVDYQDDWGWTALRHAVRKNQLQCVETLISMGADVDIPAKNGRTPLISATLAGQYEMCEMLMGYGADPMIVDSVGKTAYDHLGKSSTPSLHEFRELVSGGQYRAEESFMTNYDR